MIFEVTKKRPIKIQKYYFKLQIKWIILFGFFYYFYTVHRTIYEIIIHRERCREIWINAKKIDTRAIKLAVSRGRLKRCRRRRTTRIYFCVSISEQSKTRSVVWIMYGTAYTYKSLAVRLVHWKRGTRTTRNKNEWSCDRSLIIPYCYGFGMNIFVWFELYSVDCVLKIVHFFFRPSTVKGCFYNFVTMAVIRSNGWRKNGRLSNTTPDVQFVRWNDIYYTQSE